MAGNVSETPRDPQVLGQHHEIKEESQPQHSKASVIAQHALAPKNKDPQPPPAGIKGKIALFESGGKHPEVASKAQAVAHQALATSNPKPPVAPKPTVAPKPAEQKGAAQALAPDPLALGNKKNEFFAQLKEMNTMEGPQIAQLASDLAQNIHLFTPKEQEGMKTLIRVLKLLNNPQAFKAEHEESVILRQWDTFLRKQGVSPKTYQAAVGPVREEFCKSLRKTIASHPDSFSELQAALEKKLHRLQASAIVKRLEKCSSKENRAAIQEWSSFIIDSVQKLKGFKLEAKAYCARRWEEDLEKLDGKTEGKASGVIREIPHLNPFYDPHDLDKELEGIFVEMDPVKLQDSKKEVCEKVYRNARDLYKPEIKWVADHAAYVKNLYDQGKDQHRNMGAGTCFVNSLERHEILLQNPYVSSQELSMGSSLKGRMLQKFLDEESRAAGDDLVKMKSVSAALYKKAGLSNTGYYTITTKKEEESIYDALLRTLSKLAKQNNSLFTLGLDLPAGGTGHAFNIQCDLQKPLFRFMDDNLGVVECPDAQSFGETLSSWLQLTYPKLTEITLETWSAA